MYRDTVQAFFSNFVLMFAWVVLISVFGWAGYSLWSWLIIPAGMAVWTRAPGVIIWFGASIVCSACTAAIITYKEVKSRRRLS